MNIFINKRQVIFVCLSLLLLAGCSRQSPRDVTFKFINAVLDGDSLAILEYLDIDGMVEKRMQLIPDTLETPESLREKILQNLTGDGLTRTNWLKQKIVVNREIVQGDSAKVEMTFMDESANRIDYSMVYLYRKDGRWRIYFYL